MTILLRASITLGININLGSAQHGFSQPGFAQTGFSSILIAVWKRTLIPSISGGLVGHEVYTYVNNVLATLPNLDSIIIVTQSKMYSR